MPIHQPITQYEVGQELQKQTEEATAEVGQKYTINTFDLGVSMKALPLVWKSPEKIQAPPSPPRAVSHRHESCHDHQPKGILQGHLLTVCEAL